MLSYSRGPEMPLLDLTIGEVFAETVAKDPDREALVVPHQNVRLTYRELAAEVEQTARGLAGLDLKPGDRVGLWAANSMEWILVQLGCARAGLILVTVNPAYRAYELAHVLRKSRMRALFLWPRDARVDYRQILEEASSGQNPALEHVIFFGQESWERLLARGKEIGWPPPQPHDVANIQYTSGTTGAAKGVLLTHHNLVNNAVQCSPALKLTGQDRVCSPLPLYHCFGSVCGVLYSILKGSTLILPSAQFDPLATLEAIHAERATIIYGVPSMFAAELDHPEFDRFDCTSLRSGIMGGAPCPAELVKRVMERMHVPGLVVGYGQTEAAPAIAIALIGDTPEVRRSTVGGALPDTEVKIVSPLTGEMVPAGEQGELCARGPQVMQGYDDEPEATWRAIDEDGWLHTGDLATMRPDENFCITGRLEPAVRVMTA